MAKKKLKKKRKKAKKRPKKAAPVAPPSKVLILDYREYTSGGHDIDPDDRWSSRTDKHTDFQPKLFVRDRQALSDFWAEEIEVSDEVYNANIVHLVVVRYSDGDTFGHGYGYWEIVGVFANVIQARELEHLLARDPSKYKGNKPWEGYFARYEYAESYMLSVL